jgi:hypothetical protein
MGQKAKSDEKKGGMWKSFKKTFFIFGFRFWSESGKYGKRIVERM